MKFFCPIKQEIGDIILVSSKKKFIQIGQFFFDKDKNFMFTKYTHVIIALTPGMYIEAMTNNLVRVFCYDELKKRLINQYTDWKVLRKKNLTKKEKLNILESYSYFLEQKYNYNFFTFDKKYDSSYCSELMYKIFKKANISLYCEIFHKNPIWPIDIAKLDYLCSEEWEDATKKINSKECYNEYIKEEIIVNMCRKNKMHINIITEMNKTLLYLKQIKNQALGMYKYLKKTVNTEVTNIILILKNDFDNLTFEIEILESLLKFFCDFYNKKQSHKYLDFWFGFELIKKNSNYFFLDYVQIKMKFLLTYNSLFSELFTVFIFLIQEYNKEKTLQKVKIDLQKIKELIVKFDQMFNYTYEDIKKAEKKIKYLKENYNVIKRTYCIKNQYQLFILMESFINNIKIYKETFKVIKKIL